MKDDSLLISLSEKAPFDCFFFFVQSPALESLAASAAGKDHFLQMVLTHFLLISTMSVIKLQFHIIFFFLFTCREGGEWVGLGTPPQYHFPSLVLGKYEAWENYQSSEIQL